MTESLYSLSLLSLLVGALIILTVVLRVWFRRFGVPYLVGALILGLVLGALDRQWGLVSHQGRLVFDFLAGIGVICLLFRVGLESNLHGLIEKLPGAVPVWVGNVVLSGVPGYLAARYLLGLALIPSFFVATALTATSLAVSVAMWREAGALRSASGETLVDVAELDDISGIVLLALLLAVVPVLRGGGEGDLYPVLAATGGLFLLKAAVFGAFCLLFARYAERPLGGFMRRAGRANALLTVLGVGIMIAALAGLLGFSLAIGALFAGLVFSRDPDAVRIDTAFDPIHDFFIPFFFIGVGLGADPAALGDAMGPAAVLLAVAVLGKVVGAGGPALLTAGWSAALLIGVSMVPRAEIAMVIMQEGRKLGDWAVPPEAFAAMIAVSIATCVATPLVVAYMLKRWPQAPGR